MKLWTVFNIISNLYIMVFHDGFIIKRMDILVSPGWFEQRADLYKKVSMWQNDNKTFDEVFWVTGNFVWLA